MPGFWIFAAGFSNALMLLAASGAVIPVILHLLNRRRQAARPWAAMRILTQAVQQQARRLRIEQLLLLAVRTAIPVVLAIALARPFFDSQQSGQGDVHPARKTYWIIAIDVSYSMQYENKGASLLAQAKSMALAELGPSAAGDAYALVALDGPSRSITARPIFDLSSMQSEVRGLDAGYTGMDLAGGLDLLEDLAGFSGGDSIPGDVRILIYSDMGRDGWEVDPSVNRRLHALSQQHSVSLHPLDAGQVVNDVLAQIVVPSGRAIRGRPSQIEVVVERYGVSEEGAVSLRLEVDGRTVSSKDVMVESGRRQVIPMDVRFESTGTVVVTASLEDDRLSVDNRQSQVVEVAESTRVLIAEEESGGSLPIQLALAARLSNLAKLDIEVISSVALVTSQLDEFEVVILQDVATIAPLLAKEMHRFVDQGGAAIFLHGPLTVPGVWNRAWSTDNPLLAYRLVEPSVHGLVELDPEEYQSPILEPFRGYTESGLLTTPIFRYWRVDPQTDLPSRKVLGTQTGEPIIVSWALGEGRLASLLSAPSDGLARDGGASWNAIVTWPSFVPLMQRMVDSVLDRREQGSSTVGEVLSGRSLGANSSSQLQRATVMRPDGEVDEIVQSPPDSRGRREWVYIRANEPGVYTVNSGDGDNVSVAVNIEPLESSMKALDPAEYPRLAAPIVPVDGGGSAAVQAAAPVEVDVGDGLGRWLLVAVAGLLVGESLLAWWFGRRLG